MLLKTEKRGKIGRKAKSEKKFSERSINLSLERVIEHDYILETKAKN